MGILLFYGRAWRVMIGGRTPGDQVECRSMPSGMLVLLLLCRPAAACRYVLLWYIVDR